MTRTLGSSKKKVKNNKKNKTSFGKKKRQTSQNKELGFKADSLKDSLDRGTGPCVSFRDIWPQERDVMIRPDRYRYVRKLVKPEGCVFCTCAKNAESVQTLTIKKTSHSMVVLNKFPYNAGHLLVLPRRHCGDILSLSHVEYKDLMKSLRNAVKVLGHVYGCDGMNLGMNHGAVAGAGIPEHLHWHVIPRWFGDVNFFPLIAETKVVVESLESTYRQIRQAWEELI